MNKSQLCTERRKNAYTWVHFRYLQSSKMTVPYLWFEIRIESGCRTITLRNHQPYYENGAGYRPAKGLLRKPRGTARQGHTFNLRLAVYASKAQHKRPITKYRHWTIRRKKISHLLPQGNAQVHPSPADHSGQLRAEGQESFLLSSLRNGSAFNGAARNRFHFPLFASPLLQKFAKWKDDHGQRSARDENLISPRILLTCGSTGSTRII